MLHEPVNCARINSILQQPHGYKLQESHSKSIYRFMKGITMNQNIGRRPAANITKLKHKCPTGKIRFKDHKLCVATLHKAANHRANDLEQLGFTKRNEVRSYKCNLCSGWHLSSKANWDSRKEAA